MKELQSYLGKELLFTNDDYGYSSIKKRFEQEGMVVIAITEPQVVYLMGVRVGIEYILNGEHIEYDSADLENIEIK